MLDSLIRTNWQNQLFANLKSLFVIIKEQLSKNVVSESSMIYPVIPETHGSPQDLNFSSDHQQSPCSYHTPAHQVQQEEMEPSIADQEFLDSSSNLDSEEFERAAQNHQIRRIRSRQICFITEISSSIRNCLFVTDENSGISFLVDSGAVCSIIPRSCLPARIKPDRDWNSNFQAANNTDIATYGSTIMTLDLGLGRELPWNFTIADVYRPILGADFLAYNGILLDLRNGRLLDSTHLSSNWRNYLDKYYKFIYEIVHMILWNYLCELIVLLVSFIIGFLIIIF